MEGYTLLKEFYDQDSLLAVQSVLIDHNIDFEIDQDKSHLNVAYGQASASAIRLFVLEEKLEEASALIKNISVVEEVDVFPIQNYLDEELIEIVQNPDEWHTDFILNAKKELNERGVQVSESDVQQNLDRKIAQLKQGKAPYLPIYYFLWFISILGGFFGIIGGYFFMNSKESGFDGNKYPTYSEKYRKNGKYMFVFGIVSLVLQFSFLFYQVMIY